MNISRFCPVVAGRGEGNEIGESIGGIALIVFLNPEDGLVAEEFAGTGFDAGIRELVGQVVIAGNQGFGGWGDVAGGIEVEQLGAFLATAPGFLLGGWLHRGGVEPLQAAVSGFGPFSASMLGVRRWHF